MNNKPILFSTPMVQAILAGKKTQTRRVIKPQPAYDCHYRISETGNALHLADNYPEGNCFVPPTPNSKTHILPCPFGKVGDLLWVRETWSLVREFLDYKTGGIYCAFEWEGTLEEAKQHLNNCSAVYYPADGEEICPTEMFDNIGLNGKLFSKKEIRWRPSIHMPRFASRITLEITNIRVERRKDITVEDSIAEGIERNHYAWRNYLEPLSSEKAYGLIPQDSYATLSKSINGTDSWDLNPWVWVIEFKPHLMNVDYYIEQKKQG